MQQNFNTKLDREKLQSITYLVGCEEQLMNVANVSVKPIFDTRIMEFFEALSKKILHIPGVKQYSDVVSYAFWIRRQSIAKEFLRYEGRVKLGRGVAFHVAPSNVAVNFAVSFTSALLAGNPCVVRVSNKEFPQVDMICGAISELFGDEFADIKEYLTIVRYGHNETINEALSSVCDIRIVWGGDATLATIRKAQIPPRAIEMAFPDRHSLAVIDADAYLLEDAKKVADLFYIDTYFTDQNACSSPRLIVWTGKEINKAKEIFYHALEDKLKAVYEMAPILAIDKLNALCSLAATREGVICNSDDNVLVRVKVDALTADLMNYKMGGGYFFEYDTDNLEDMLPVLTKRCQTLSYLGVDKEVLQDMILNNGVKGVDRIVPMGHTMDLTFIWDGYDMIDTMSRYLT